MKEKGGFTLIELVIVIIILGVLAAIGIPMYLTTIERARAQEAIDQIQVIKGDQDARALSRATYSTSLTALGYNADPFQPQTLWNYTLTNNGRNVTAVRADGLQVGRHLILVLGAINATTNQPAAAGWAPVNATTQSGQP